MGYITNCLPRALARLGHEVHLIVSVAQPYFSSPLYDSVYEPFIGPRFVEEVKRQTEGYTLYRLPFFSWRGRMGLRHLNKVVDAIDPDVVEVFVHSSISALQLAILRTRKPFAFFTANHVLPSVFPVAHKQRMSPLETLKMNLFSKLPGRVVSVASDGCHAPTVDAGEIATKFLGVQEEKVRAMPLGVDTDHFQPVMSQDDQAARKKFRRELGITDEHILCVYTGRFSEGKNPLCLADAVARLQNRGEPFSALFVGSGPQADQLRASEGSTVTGFVEFRDLPALYKAADVGVWPREESTSVLDASGAGLPVVVSDRVRASERIRGNGLTYVEDDPDDLAETLMKLKPREVRDRLGREGREKIEQHYSWEAVARRRLEAYEAALRAKNPLRGRSRR